MTGHHLYRKYFTPAEQRVLKAIPENDVVSEMNILRIMLVRFLRLHGKSPSGGLKSQLDALRVISDSASMIAGLVRTQIKVHNPDTELSRVLEAALDELRREMNI